MTVYIPLWFFVLCAVALLVLLAVIFFLGVQVWIAIFQDWREDRRRKKAAR